MGLIKVFLERPRILILTLIFFLLVGYSGFNNIPRQEMPELAERWGVVIQVYPGASPDRIETQVTEILEIKLREIPEIRNLNSKSYCLIIDIDAVIEICTCFVLLIYKFLIDPHICPSFTCIRWF